MISKSLNYWSLPQGLEGALAVEAFLEKAKRFGYDAVELCIGEEGSLSLETSQGRCESIRRQALEMGVPVLSVASGLYWSYSLGSATEAERARAEEALKQMVRITAWLGAKTLLTIPGVVDVFFQPECAPLRYDEVWERSRKGLAGVL